MTQQSRTINHVERTFCDASSQGIARPLLRKILWDLELSPEGYHGFWTDSDKPLRTRGLLPAGPMTKLRWRLSDAGKSRAGAAQEAAAALSTKRVSSRIRIA